MRNVRRWLSLPARDDEPSREGDRFICKQCEEDRGADLWFGGEKPTIIQIKTAKGHDAGSYRSLVQHVARHLPLAGKYVVLRRGNEPTRLRCEFPSSTWESLNYELPSFLTGAARTLDIGDTFDLYLLLENPNELDARAIAGDWGTVGRDLLDAAKAYHAAKQQVAKQSPPPAKPTPPSKNKAT